MMSSHPALNTSEMSTAYRELEDKYMKLNEDYNKLLQEMHVMSLHLSASKKTSVDLSNELEVVSKEYNESLAKVQAKQTHLLQVQEASWNSDRDRLQQERDQMLKCVETLTEKLGNAAKNHTCSQFPGQPEPMLPKETTEWHLEEIKKLQEMLYTSESTLGQVRRENAHLSEEIANLNERHEALLSNHECVKQEVDELKNLLEGAQEHSAQLALEIHGMRLNPDGNTNKKGNSLFAEVDDQRKHLMNIIDRIKKRYYVLKEEHRNCPASFRSLRNAQMDLATQLKRCMGVIEAAESSYVKSLQKQNSQIMAELQQSNERNDYLNQQLTKNSELWVESLIDYTKEQVDSLRARMRQCLLNHRLAEDEHLWRAKELQQVRLELARLKLNSCNDLLGAMVECYDQPPDEQNEDDKLPDGSCGSTTPPPHASIESGETAENSLENKTNCGLVRSISEPREIETKPIIAKPSECESAATGITVQQIYPKTGSVVVRRYKIHFETKNASD